MSWLTAPLRKVAPPVPAQILFAPDDQVWLLSLDQIESETGEIVGKRYAAASNAGTSTFNFDTGNVLYSKLRPYLNKVVIPDEVGIATTELIPLRPDPKTLNPRFLAYYLRSPRFVNQASHHVAGAKMPRVVMDWFWEHEAPIPSPKEQSRIVELLDEADRLRRLRREADAKAARILPALFLKMFGDPATNPKGLPVKLMGDPAVCEINPRTRVRLDDSVLVSFVAMADVDEVLGRITGTQSRPYGEVKKGFTPFKDGDVLFAKITPCMQNGKAAIASGLVGGIGFGSTEFHVLRAGPDVTPEYLFALVRLQSFRNHAMSAFTGSAGQQRVPTEFLRQFRLPVPTATDLHKFSNVMRQLIACQIQAERAAEKLGAQFHLLLQRAFSGQLTAKWREAHMKELLAEMEQQARLLNLPLPKELEAVR
ncbi:restriction endonuclease subunit S [Thioalkalivibrio sulfidiphilus]|uniref:restriction endonuclease subunit S n=1 Tax=Thioalkalivibrio sulfidiphilus TaxID=1033854 RepID=UPI0003A29CD9|nr:restriction endonuclease subunit S [Thioalkalivibrio sulfidiphilus]